MAVTNPAGTSPAGLPPDVARMLEDADRWNRYADKMNRKALAAGLISADTLIENARRTETARRRILATYGLTPEDWETDPDLRARPDELDQQETRS